MESGSLKKLKKKVINNLIFDFLPNGQEGETRTALSHPLPFEMNLQTNEWVLPPSEGRNSGSSSSSDYSLIKFCYKIHGLVFPSVVHITLHFIPWSIYMISHCLTTSFLRGNRWQVFISHIISDNISENYWLLPVLKYYCSDSLWISCSWQWIMIIQYVTFSRLINFTGAFTEASFNTVSKYLLSYDGFGLILS